MEVKRFVKAPFIMLGLLLITLGVMPYAAPHLDQWNQSINTSGTILNAGTSIGQVLTLKNEGFNRVRFFHQPALVSSTLTAFLSASPSDETPLATTSITIQPGKSITDVHFENIELPKGSTPYFYLKSNLNNQEALLVYRLLVSSNNYYINHEREKGELLLRLRYTEPNNWLARTHIIFQNMSQYKPAWAKIPFLYVYVVIFFVGILEMLRKLTDQNTHK